MNLGHTHSHSHSLNPNQNHQFLNTSVLLCKKAKPKTFLQNLLESHKPKEEAAPSIQKHFTIGLKHQNQSKNQE